MITFSPGEELETLIRDAYMKDDECTRALEETQVLGGPTLFSANDKGLLLYRGLIYIPDNREVRLRLLNLHHNAALAGHPGQRRTLELIQRNYYFPQMRAYVEAYVSSCDVCARSKAERHKPYGTLRSLTVPERRWQSISLDLIIALPPSADPVRSGTQPYDSIWVVVDRLTKMTHLVPTYEALSSEDMAYMYIEHVFSKHGAPSSIISDRGGHFASRFMKAFCENLGAKLHLSTAFHPQTNGQTERTNQGVEQYLRAYCNYQQDDWVTWLPLAEFQLNNSLSASTGTTPFYANYGFHPTMTLKALPDTDIPSADERALLLDEIQELLKHQLTSALELQAKYYDRKHKPAPEFAVGEQAWLLRRYIQTERPSDKLDDKKLGPFRITKVIGSHARKLELPKSMKIHPVFHVSLLEQHVTGSERYEVPTPQPVVIEGEEEWEVERIEDHRRQQGKTQYLVLWKGGTSPQRTWEPEENLENATEVLEQFRSSNLQPPPGPGRTRRRKKPEEKVVRELGGHAEAVVFIEGLMEGALEDFRPRERDLQVRKHDRHIATQCQCVVPAGLAGPVLPVVGVQDGASLAGNDSSEASATRSSTSRHGNTAFSRPR